MYITLNKAVS